MAREDVKRQIAIAVALFSIVSVILVLIGGVSYFSIKGTQEKEAQKYMKEIVSQYKNIITAQIDGDIQTLDAVAAITGQDSAVDLDTVLSYLKEECSRNDFIHMVLSFLTARDILSTRTATGTMGWISAMKTSYPGPCQADPLFPES